MKQKVINTNGETKICKFRIKKKLLFLNLHANVYIVNVTLLKIHEEETKFFLPLLRLLLLQIIPSLQPRN